MEQIYWNDIVYNELENKKSDLHNLITITYRFIWYDAVSSLLKITKHARQSRPPHAVCVFNN